jgi:NTP pyrophosphatase (non-canonical NTP hydrolase)
MNQEEIIEGSVEAKVVYSMAMDKFGLDAQMDMLIEECSELIQAALKLKRKKYNDFDSMQNFNEEMADVLNMIDQFIHFGDCANSIEQIKVEKLNRLLNILTPTP